MSLLSGIAPLASVPDEPTPHSNPWRVEPIANFGGSAAVPLDVDSVGRPHVMYCPPGESWYAVRGESGWVREFLTATPFGGVCGELALGPRYEVHVTTPVAAGIGDPLYGVRENGAWTFEPTDIGSVQAVDSVGRPHSAYLVRTAADRVTMRHVWREGSWQTEDIESFAAPLTINARWASVAVDAADNLHVLYYEDARGDVRYAIKNSTGWRVEVVEHAGFVGRAGRGGQISLLSDGIPAAVYGTGLGPLDVRYAVRTATGWTSEIVDDTATFLVHPTLMMRKEDSPCLAYEWIQEIDQAKIIWDQDLLLRCRGESGWTREVVVDGFIDNPADIAVFAQFPDLRADSCGNPHLAFYYNLRVGTDDSGKGVYYATKGEPCPAKPDQPVGFKHEAIQRTRTLKERALERGDSPFVESLDDAERSVWRSLGYADPLRPAGITPEQGPDVAVRWNRGDRVGFVLGPSWTPRLRTYDALRVSWENGDFTNVDLPHRWPARPLRYHDEAWVDAWEQDLAIDSRRDWRTGAVTLTVRVRDASLGFTLSLDADEVATLTFAYEVRPWWKDGTHLDPTDGHRVFAYERRAVECLITFTARDGGDDDDDDEDDDGDGGGIGPLHGDNGRERNVGCDDRDPDDDSDDEEDESSPPRCPLTASLWSEAELAELDAECATIADLLVAADEGLARIALDDARDTAVRDPRNQAKVDRELGGGEKDFARARAARDEARYADAIRFFEDAWEHAQRAIRFANR